MALDSGDVLGYLDAHKLEEAITAAVAECVEKGASQPLAFLASLFAKRHLEAAVDFDYKALCADIKALVRAKRCGALFVRLSWHDAATFSAALGGGGPNAAMRFAEGGEAAFEANAGLDVPIALLAPLKAKYPKISHADLWALAANLAIEEMGGPSIATRFGRVDANSAADSVEGPVGRLADGACSEAQLRELYYAKGFNDREIVALSGAHTVGGCQQFGAFYTPAASELDGNWTDEPHTFDASYYVDLLGRKWVAHAAADGRTQFKEAGGGSSNVMLLSDLALAEDAAFRPWVEAYAADAPKFLADFAGAWWKLQELGCARLVPHPASLEYASSCFLPTSWLELPLLARREYNYNSTVYTFGLPAGQSLQLPVCSCLLLRVPGRGRGPGGKDDWDGSDAVRPYTPITAGDVTGRFELLVKRYDGGAASHYLHALPLGGMVGFKHTRANLKAQYPFDGVRTVSMLCTGGGLPPMYQALRALLETPGDDRQVVLLYGAKSSDDLLMAEQLREWAAKAAARFKLVYVVGSQPDELAPPGWEDTAEFTAETGWIDQAKIRKYCYPPADDTLVMVCGRPAICNMLCGPRTEPELRPGSALHELGYAAEMVVKM